MYTEILCMIPRATFQLFYPRRSVMFSPTSTHIISLNEANNPQDQVISFCNIRLATVQGFLCDTQSVSAANFSSNGIDFGFPRMTDVNRSRAQAIPILSYIALEDTRKPYRPFNMPVESNDYETAWKSFSYLNENVSLYAAGNRILIYSPIDYLANQTDASWHQLGANVQGNIEHVFIAPDGKKIAALTHGQKQATVFVLNDDNAVEFYLQLSNNNNYKTLLFNPQSSLIISAHKNIIRIFDINEQKRQGRSFNSDDNSTNQDLAPCYECLVHSSLRRRKANINALAISPSGDLLASAASNSVHFWNLPHQFGEFGTELYVGKNNTVNHVTFSPDGKLVAGATSSGKIYIWDLEDTVLERAKSKLILDNLKDSATCVAFSADSRSVVAGSVSGKICVWDI